MNKQQRLQFDRQQCLQKELNTILKRLAKVEKLPLTPARREEIKEFHRIRKQTWRKLEDLKKQA